MPLVPCQVTDEVEGEHFLILMEKCLMSEPSNSRPRHLHPDFPNEPIIAAVGGAQLKLALCRGDDGMYRSPRRSPEEVMHRFEVADDLADQLVTYFKRKKSEYPEWTDEKNFERIRLALINKAREGKWPFTDSEQAWIMCRLRERSVERELPIFSASQLRIAPQRTPEDIRQAIEDGRFAEMTPDQSGYDGVEN